MSKFRREQYGKIFMHFIIENIFYNKKVCARTHFVRERCRKANSPAASCASLGELLFNREFRRNFLLNNKIEGILTPLYFAKQILYLPKNILYGITVLPSLYTILFPYKKLLKLSMA